MKPLLAAPLGLAAAGAAGLGYAYAEARAYTLRHVSVPVLAAGAAPLRVLHLSDLHMTPGQRRKQEWVRALDELDPDLVVSTGDNLAHHDVLPALLEAYGPLLDRPGVFVFGSNDYFAPIRKNPLGYLTGGSGVAASGAWERTPTLPFEELRAAFTGAGWLDLNNRTGSLDVAGRRIAFAGVDDPHLEYDELSDVSPDPRAELDVAVAHAPYLRVLDHFTERGFPLLLAGHTHGGQLCVPFRGALVTNCDLDTARAKGLHTHQVPGRDPAWLHVSAGLGTSPYVPFRFACRPEATLLTLTGIDSPGLSA